MEEKETVKECLAELLETYFNGSFSQMACDYIRSTGMTPEEVEELLEVMRFLWEQKTLADSIRKNRQAYVLKE